MADPPSPMDRGIKSRASNRVRLSKAQVHSHHEELGGKVQAEVYEKGPERRECQESSLCKADEEQQGDLSGGRSGAPFTRSLREQPYRRSWRLMVIKYMPKALFMKKERSRALRATKLRPVYPEVSPAIPDRTKDHPTNTTLEGHSNKVSESIRSGKQKHVQLRQNYNKEERMDRDNGHVINSWPLLIGRIRRMLALRPIEQGSL